MIEATERWSSNPAFVLDDSRNHQLDAELERDQADEIPAYHRRKSAGIWTAMASLALALAVLAAYGYAVLDNDNLQLSQLPRLAKSLSAVSLHSLDLERRLQDVSEYQKGLTARMQKADVAWQSGLDAARAQPAGLVAGLRVEFRRELDSRSSVLKAQIARMASDQDASRAQLAEVEQELARTRQELASVRRSQAQELAELRREQNVSHFEITSINNLLATNQVGFAIQKGQPAGVVPGVSLNLTGTDVRHQRFDGWIGFQPQGRTLQMRAQEVQQPFVFFPNPGGRAYELVVTQVDPGKVTGYLLVPAGANKETLASYVGPDPATTGEQPQNSTLR
ncbi:MAG: hypothetical protein LAP13_17515 [Acidobacteriia bacterium]|nr:hypothetical protein [Terriglobia bacterium]